jgi:tRNA(adenine34) deaminase
MTELDSHYMRQALDEARAAGALGEIPVGAIVVCGRTVVGRGGNRKEATQDPTAHAEILALRQAAAHLGRWRLSGCSVYVTLEPCPMCVGAMLSARVDRLVFGCADPKAGVAVTLLRLADDPRFNHRMEVAGGVGAEEAAQLLRAFFQERRRGRENPEG